MAPDGEGTAVGFGVARSDGVGVGCCDGPEGLAVGLAMGTLRNILAKLP